MSMDCSEKGCMNQNAIKRKLLSDIQNLAVYEVELQAGAAEVSHKHQGPQVTYVVEGSIDLQVEGKHIEMAAGESILVLEGQLHSATAKEFAKLICIR